MSTAKSDIIKKLANSYPNFIQRDLKRLINITLYEMSSALARGERVEVRGCGTFGTKHRMPKKARNPGTGEAIFLPERHVPTFKPAKYLRSRVNDSLMKK